MIDLNKLDGAAFGPVLEFVLFFGGDRPKFIGGNHKNNWRVGHSKRGKLIPMSYTKSDATLQSEYIAGVALEAALHAGWVIPAYCKVDLFAFNIPADRANFAKTVEDPMQKICIPNDRFIIDGRCPRLKDKGPSRILVAIQAVDGKAFGFPKPSKKRSPHGSSLANETRSSADRGNRREHKNLHTRAKPPHG